MEKCNKTDLGNRITKLRESKGEKQSDLLDVLGYKKHQQVSYIENGNENRNLSLSQIISLAKHFDVSTDYLLGLTEDKISLTINENIALRTASDYTGLSSTALKELPKITNNFLKHFKTKYILEDLIIGGYLYDIINSLNEYVIVKNKNEQIINEVVNLINQTPFISEINEDYSYMNLFEISELIDASSEDYDTANKIQNLLKDYDKDYLDLMMFKAQKTLNAFFYHINDRIKEGEANEKE